MSPARCRLSLCAVLLLSFPQLGRAAEAVSWIRDAALPEISGCAASRLAPGRLWLHNDSGNAAELFAVDAQGRLRQRVAIDGVPAIDWEDLAAFVWRGQPYLAIADTGDNFAIHAERSIVLLPEPGDGVTQTPAARTIRFRYAQGPRDLEAVAVDAAAGQILLLEKRRPPATLYALQLDGPDVQVAQPLARLADWWPEPATPIETLDQQRYRAAATAMDLSPDGRRLAVLSNTHWALFERASHEGWASVLARAPRAVGRLPRRTLAVHDTIFEALCWDADGRGLWISGERLPAPLLHVELPAP